MNTRRSSALLAGLIPLALAACPLSAGASSGIDLVVKGRSDFQIVVAANAIPSERYAAEELQRYLEKMTGVKLPVTDDAQPATRREILIGESTRLRRVQAQAGALGTDGFLLRSERDRLVIHGGKPRGTLNGVYTLLEEQLGVRWYTPDLEVVPRTNRLTLARLDEVHSPALEYREVYWTDVMRDGDFAARHRLNGQHCRLKQKHGGPAAVYYPFVHSFDLLIPPQLFGEHPEYFPLIDGKRYEGYAQRCLSNPDVRRLAIARVRQWIREHPDATIISVSQNDTRRWCRCEACKNLDDREGSPAASLIQFVNAIAEDLERDFPAIRIDTLAYQYTRKPPKTLRPHPNVIIRLCSIECCFAHPLASCDSPENARFREDLRAWQPVAPKLYVWDYTPNFAHYQQPFPNFAVLQPNVRFFAAHRVTGLFEQGNYSPGGLGELGPLRAYLLAKLLWNPKADVEKHMQEFLFAYYGQAGPSLRAYIALLQSQVTNPSVHAHIFDSTRAVYLNDSFLRSAETLFEQAEESAENETARFRVQVARLPIRYVQLVTGRVTGRVSGEAREQRLADFLAVARKARITHISEHESLESWARKQTAKTP